MRPGLVDEILATVARGRDYASALAARHDMMSACGNFPQAKNAGVIHTAVLGSSKFVTRQF
jgi:hypothetical protein